MTAADVTLNVITDTALCGGPQAVAAVAVAAVQGGATLVQVRDPHADDDMFTAIARSVCDAIRPTGVPVVLNDRVHLVAGCGAQGAHVGQGDMPAAEARAVLGPDAILGLSVHDDAELAAALALPTGTLDYIGVGPVWPQSTKPGAQPAIGVARVRDLAAASRWPVVAIGGVGPGRCAELARAGAGMAAVSAICAAASPEQSARAMMEEWRNA